MASIRTDLAVECTAAAPALPGITQQTDLINLLHVGLAHRNIR